MATVFENSMVAHVWAQGRQTEGRSHNGNFFFQGRALYSYGSHFIVGYLMPDGAALLNADSYSISTSRHQAYARHAVRGAAYAVPSLTALVNGHGLYWLAKRGDAEARTLARRAIVRHVADHILSMSEESALYLLGLVGRARSYGKLKRDAERARDKAKAEKRKREIAARISDAKAFDAMNDSQFREALADVEGKRVYINRPWPQRDKGHYKTPAENVADYGREVHRLHVAAKAHGTPALARRIAARLKTIRARKATLAKWESHSAELATFMRYKAAFKELKARRMASGPLPRKENMTLARLARHFATYESGLISQESRVTWSRIADACEAQEARAVEAENRERMEREREARDAWLAGSPDAPRYWRGSDEKGGALLRAVDVTRDESGAIVGGTLQTSHGAECPLPHALKAFQFVRLVVRKCAADSTCEGWRANGKAIRVGHFRVDSIDGAGTMRAGCHTIHLAEMERLATVLGVADIAPDDSALEPSRGAA